MQPTNQTSSLICVNYKCKNKNHDHKFNRSLLASVFPGSINKKSMQHSLPDGYEILISLWYPYLFNTKSFSKSQTFPYILQKIVRYYCFTTNYKLHYGKLQFEKLKIIIVQKKKVTESLLKKNEIIMDQYNDIFKQNQELKHKNEILENKSKIKNLKKKETKELKNFLEKRNQTIYTIITELSLLISNDAPFLNEKAAKIIDKYY